MNGPKHKLYDKMERGATYKSHAMTSSEIFNRETFCGTKMTYTERSEAMAWFGTQQGLC